MPKESAIRAREIAMRYREEAKKDDRAKELLEIGSQAPYRSNATPEICDDFEGKRLIIFYHFISDYLIRLTGFTTAYGIIKEALRRWGDNRGREMKEDHKKRDWDLNIKNFITYHDDCAAGDAWIAQNVVLTPKEHRRIVTKSLYASMLDEMGTGKLGILFGEEPLKAQVLAYNPSIKVEIPRLMERGDDVSEFHFKLV